MQLYILISIVIAVLAIGVAIALIITTRRSLANRNATTEGEYPKDYWMGVGISTGVGIGTALGIALENIGIGIALGTAIGVGIGASMEQKNKDNIRPLTEQEKKRQKWGVAAGLAIPLILIGFVIVLMLLRTR